MHSLSSLYRIDTMSLSQSALHEGGWGVEGGAFLGQLQPCLVSERVPVKSV